MSWLLLVVIAVLGDSTRIFLDNYISDVYYKGRGSAGQKIFYGWFFVIVAILIALIFGIEFDKLTIGMAIALFISGILSTVAGFPYYKALEIDDSTNLSIFIQLAPVLYLVLGWFFLGEAFSISQLFAFAIILAGPFLIIFTTRKRSRKTKIKAVLMAAAYVVISVIGNLIFVKANTSGMHFTTPMALLFLGKGFSNLMILYCGQRKLVNRYRDVMKQSRRKVLRPLILDGLICVVKDFAYRGALITAPAVALASAVSDSSEPIVIFLMGIVLSLIWPKFGREKLNRKSVLTHLAATILVVIGVIILQF